MLLIDDRTGSGKPEGATRLRVRPLSFRQVCAFIAAHHRHHKPPRGGKVFIGVETEDSMLVGVMVIGRPVARHYDDGWTFEVNRSCTQGHPNANSCLYGAARRIGFAMGYRRGITYTQDGECGSSLRGAGWVHVTSLPARGSWAESSQKLKALRDPVGTGGVGRDLWEVRRAAAR